MAVDAGWDFVEVDVLVLLALKLLLDLLFVSRLWNFLDWGLGFFAQEHGVCLGEVLSFLQVGDLVHFCRVGLVNGGAFWVRVALHDPIEEVSGVKVAEEREYVFAIFAIPERRTDAPRGLCRYWDLRHDEAGLFLLLQGASTGLTT